MSQQTKDQHLGVPRVLKLYIRASLVSARFRVYWRKGSLPEWKEGTPSSWTDQRRDTPGYAWLKGRENYLPEGIKSSNPGALSQPSQRVGTLSTEGEQIAHTTSLSEEP